MNNTITIPFYVLHWSWDKVILQQVLHWALTTIVVEQMEKSLWVEDFGQDFV